MKVLMLVISSDTFPSYASNRGAWRHYMKSDPRIDIWFIQYRAGSLELTEDTLWLPGTESYDGILPKTLDSIDYFLQRDTYDFVVRTNLSSFWNIPALLRHLETLPTTGVYSGGVTYYDRLDVTYASGSGFIMTPDIAMKLVENRSIAESVRVIDDVDIGYAMMKLGIPLLPASRVDLTTDSKNIEPYDPNAYHYRLRRNDRYGEADVMIKLLERQKNECVP